MVAGVWKLRPKAQTPDISTGKLVVTSFYPLYYLTKEIGGDMVRVVNITPAGTEPHDFELTAKDVAMTQNSTLLVLNGNGFEAWGQKIKDEIGSMGTKVVEAGEGQFVGDDPHVWLSPSLIKGLAKKILMSLSEADPRNADFYRKNEMVLQAKFDGLLERYRQGLANCSKKEFVTSHDAFSYLAKDFGLTQIAISGLSPDEEPSAKDLVEVAKLAKNKGVKYIFFETLASPKLAETVASEIGAQTLVLDPIEGIDDEGLSQGKNYFTVMEENLANLRIALECK